MIDVRRWYLYLVSAITVQAFAWALISFGRHLLLERPVDREMVALQLAAMIVTLPLFLVHWLWAQRLAGRDREERASFPRRLYLTGMLAAFLAPAVYNAFNGLRGLLNLLLGGPFSGEWAFGAPLTSGETALYALPALVVLAAFWAFHWVIRGRDDRRQAESDAGAVLNQLYRYAFALVGLSMAAVAVGLLLERLLAGFWPGLRVLDPVRTVLASELARLAIGLALWLPFWLPAQRRFAAGDEREQSAVVRKAYLYLVAFVGALGTIFTTAVLLADLLARLMGVSGESGGLSTALSIILVSAAMWAYHAFVLRRDAAAAPEREQQALVRRIYTYLMAGLGLAAVLIGLSGTLIQLLEGLDSGIFTTVLRESLSGFIAALLAGLPVWLWHWQQGQRESAQPAPAGPAERRAFVRRLYLYLYIFVATLMMIGSVIFIISQALMFLMDAREAAGLWYELAQAFSITLVAVAVWVYHGLTLRQDGQAITAAEAAQLKALHIAVVDAGDGALGQTLARRLQEKVPGAIIQPVGLTPAAMAVMNGGAVEKPPLEALHEAEVIVGPWSMAVPAGHGGTVTPDLATAVTSSPAQKVLFPEPEAGYTWAGVESWQVDRLAGEVVESVRALSLGETPAGSRPGAWISALVVLAVIILLSIFLPMLAGLLFGF